MKTMPSIADVMTPFPHTIEIDQSVGSAKNIMYSHNIRHLPVLEHGKLVGLISDRDIKLTVAVTKVKNADLELKVGDVCILDAYAVSHDEKLDKVAKHLAESHIGSAIVTKQGKVVGIFTVSDACKTLSEVLHICYPDA